MKNIGVVRRIDPLGRIVLPKELRDTMELPEGTAMEIYTEGETIVLKKYSPACVFCGEAGEVIQYMGKKICKHCLKELKGAAR